MNKEEKTLVELVENEKVFDEVVEGYGNCGDSDEPYSCKRDCIFTHDARITALK